MTYVATLYSKSLDRFEIDCNSSIYWVGDLTEWLEHLPEHYNKGYRVEDWEIFSVVRIGEL